MNIDVKKYQFIPIVFYRYMCFYFSSPVRCVYVCLGAYCMLVVKKLDQHEEGWQTVIAVTWLYTKSFQIKYLHTRIFSRTIKQFRNEDLYRVNL